MALFVLLKLKETVVPLNFEVELQATHFNNICFFNTFAHTFPIEIKNILLVYGKRKFISHLA